MKRQQAQKLAVGIITGVAALVVIPVVLVIVYIVAQGIGALNWEFLTALPHGGMREGGIMPAIVGTIVLTLGTAIVCLPLALGAAIYLAEYAKDNTLTRAVRLAIVNLAGIPSVVYGLFGLGLFVFFLRFAVQWFESERRGRSHIPIAFWYLSLSGGLMTFVYALLKKDLVFMIAQALGVLIYVRNLMLISRRRARVQGRRRQRALIADGESLEEATPVGPA